MQEKAPTLITQHQEIKRIVHQVLCARTLTSIQTPNFCFPLMLP